MTRRVLPGLIAAFALVLAVVARAEARPKPRRHQPLTRVSQVAQVEVLWGGSWWKATVIGKRAGFTKIHYVGWSTSYDEWVEDKRVRALSNLSTRPPRGHSTHEILWGGRWWKGTVIERRAGLIKIHYTGWSSTWDQWVEPSRVRTLAP